VRNAAAEIQAVFSVKKKKKKSCFLASSGDSGQAQVLGLARKWKLHLGQ
jgi:hypothetical protein